jgi:hypothetical protein
MNDHILWIWSDNPAISLTVWLAITVLSMYLARKPAHLLIRAATLTLRSQFRMVAQTLSRLEIQLAKRNKEVTLALGKASSERTIEREFDRINTVVNRDLGKYPALHRQISDVIQKLEEDYNHSTDTPPASPAWLGAIEAIANAPNGSDPAVAHILKNVQTSIESAHKSSLKEYQDANRSRHESLKQMLPLWRKVSNDTEIVKETIDGLQERSKTIDEHMATYEQIRRGEDQAVRMLNSSSMTQFFVAGLVLTIAVLGGIINFQLIALPMSEMVGGTSQVGPMRTADVAALVIIMVEIAMGLFFMESVRITRLFPIIGSMDDKMRKRMAIITFTILFILASVEASLAYMRDILAIDREAITQSLTGMVVAESPFRWIPSVGQMVMGFILPFTLAFVAIPLESFIQSLRTVIGVMAGVTLRAMAFSFRVLGNFSYQLGSICIHLYDMVIMLPLRAEQLLGNRKVQKKESQAEAVPVDSTHKSFDA